ncbi:AtpZ/AtpI family protein [Oceanicella sp. SM1341]|uniref:AtpZ/AtpI family protein n=1 Tax=Oceanicella sp. SM1341 TaxID=1548889 RepID=UPI000E54ED6E|nr:AtpZ/AtpI family protein [Oceanicella sp. SM1341]
MTAPAPEQDPLAEAARRAEERARRGAETPEPSLGSRLGQIGVVGWMIVSPILLALLLGRWLDRLLGPGRITFTAALIMLGAVVGFWSAWKWMNRS